MVSSMQGPRHVHASQREGFGLPHPRRGGGGGGGLRSVPKTQMDVYGARTDLFGSLHFPCETVPKLYSARSPIAPHV